MGSVSAESTSEDSVKPHYSFLFNGGGKNCLSLFQSTMANFCLCQPAHLSMGAGMGVEISGLVFGGNCPKLSERKEHCNLPAIVFSPSVFALHY